LENLPSKKALLDKKCKPVVMALTSKNVIQKKLVLFLFAFFVLKKGFFFCIPFFEGTTSKAFFVSNSIFVRKTSLEK